MIYRRLTAFGDNSFDRSEAHESKGVVSPRGQ